MSPSPAQTASAQSAPEQGTGPLCLVDGSGYIFRAFHALPTLNRDDGTPVNAVYGFCTMLQKLLDSTDHNTTVAVIFDASGHSFRNDIYPQYKANREAPPEELVPQFALVREATRAFGLPCIEQPGFEADDLIASYASQASQAGRTVVIMSSDKDLMQLVGDGVSMQDPMRNNSVIGPAEVEAKFGVTPDKVVDVQALAGDSVDNVPGVPGIGVKTAAMLVNRFGDLDCILAGADSITQPKRRQSLIRFADQARISRDLVRLKTDMTPDTPLADLRAAAPDPAVLGPFLARQGFRTLLARMKLRQGHDGPDSLPAPATDYSVIRDKAGLDTLFARAADSGCLGLAVLTDDPEAHPRQAVLTGIALSPAPGRAGYIPLAPTADPPDTAPAADLLDALPPTVSPPTGSPDLPPATGPAAPGLTLADLRPALQAALADPGLLVVGHDLKPALQTLGTAWGGPPPALAAAEDVMLMSFVLDSGRQTHDLPALASRLLDQTVTSLQSLAGSGRNKCLTTTLPVATVLPVVAGAADMCHRLYPVLRRRLSESGLTSPYETLERPLLPVLLHMEQAGIGVVPEILRGLSDDFGQAMATFETRAHTLAGETFNIGSPKQLGEILFDRLGLPGGRKGKTGAYGTGADILADLAIAGHDLPRAVLDWRRLAKLKSTYTDALTAEIDPQTGRIHTRYGMTGAQTGRLSSNDPNLQNIPIRTPEGRKIRAAFVARPGHKLMSFDYSQIELRIVAHVAGVEPLIEAFRSGADIHAMTASQIFDIPVAGMDPLMRRRAKAVNFGIIYGISPFGLARNLGIPMDEAKRYIDAYFERYPGIRAYMDRTILFARENGFVETLFGRRIHLPAMNDRNPARRHFAERQAVNAPIQGSAADIIKRAMIRIPPVLTPGAQMLLQVHDELLFELPEEETATLAARVSAVMSSAAEPARHLDIPLIVDVGTGDNWNEAH